ncbi:hypothetical protein, partial [uncultured Akkermansia sp.]|uniref:hypothetical protein n=1 Tax=uncultured Akkermansia sp. TaxID=512294 RepID=UPI00265D33CC
LSPGRSGIATSAAPSKFPESCGRFFAGRWAIAHIFPETFDGTGNQGSLIQLAAFHVQGVRFRIPEKMDGQGHFPLDLNFFLTLFLIFRLHRNPFFGAIMASTALLRRNNAPEMVFQSTKIYHWSDVL